jgi:hypothetical protein
MNQARFDPYAILAELEGVGSFYVVVGALARVIHGSDEVTRGLDLAPSLSKENLRRLGKALDNLHARRVDGRPLELDALDRQRQPMIELTSDAGEVKIVLELEDLRHRATASLSGVAFAPLSPRPATSSA